MTRLDQHLVARGLVPTRSQAESYIRMGQVLVNGRTVTKTGYSIKQADRVKLLAKEQYVSRAGLKLASVAEDLGLDFRGEIVLDVGSSTGGFTDFALKHGAQKVIAVDVGTNQMHPLLRNDERIELHEQTDIRAFARGPSSSSIDVVVIDVSFISIREVLSYLPKIITPKTVVVAMVKPQFEVGDAQKHKGVIKNDAMRRRILRDFESWVSKNYKIINKSDSKVAGEKGNLERFYKLTSLELAN